MAQSEQINELAAALSAFQGKVKGAKKDSSNPFFKSKYADLESVWETIQPLLPELDLALVQALEYTLDGQGQPITLLRSVVLHKSGQWIDGTQPLLLKNYDPQSQGSAITYARRYGACAMLGIVQTDDDGNAASGKSNGDTQTEQPPKPTSRLVHQSSTRPGTLSTFATVPTTSGSPITQQQWDDLLILAKNNHWPEALVKEQLKRSRAATDDEELIYNKAKDKYSQPNPSYDVVETEEIPF